MSLQKDYFRYISSFVCIVFLIVVDGCKSSSGAASQTESQVLDTVTTMANVSELPDEWQRKACNSGKYFLFFDGGKSVSNPLARKDFYVEDKEGNRIYEGFTNGGYVKWYDNTKIEFFNPPGVVRREESQADFVTIYDVETGKSFKKSNLTKEK